MIKVLGLLFFIILIFGLFFLLPFFWGAPFEPTSKEKLQKILKLANIKQGEKAVDLGSGDGRIVIRMAQNGAEAHGYEVNPFLVFYSRNKIKKAGLKGKAFIHWKSFWRVDFSKFDVIVLFQFKTIMKTLEKKLEKEMKKKARVVSYYWKFPNWKYSKTIENIYLYEKIL